MALKTTLEKLEAVQAAIANAELAQSYGTGEHTHANANLEVLYRRERELLKQYRVEQGIGGPTRNIGTPRRSY